MIVNPYPANNPVLGRVHRAFDEGARAVLAALREPDDAMFERIADVAEENAGWGLHDTLRAAILEAADVIEARLSGEGTEDA